MATVLAPLLLLAAGARAEHGNRSAPWRRCHVEAYGAVAGDGRDDSLAIAAALRDCGGDAGGEIVLRGPGVYDAQPMNLTNNQVLHVASGAVLQAPTPAHGSCMNATAPCPYRVVDSFPSYTGSRDYGTSCRFGPFIGAYKAHNISIMGGGVIDGAGQFFWSQARSMTIERPRLVELQFVEDLNIGPINLRHAPFWNLHPIYSKRLHIHDISITADSSGHSSPNTDGIDPDSCKDVLIENYYYNAGDDAIAVKSGWNYAGYHMNMSSENIYARNCSSNGRGGYTIGSEMSGGVRNVSFVDSTSTGESGIRINSQPGRGGYVTDVTVRNVRFDWKSAGGKAFLFHVNQERECKAGCAGGPKCGFSCDNPNASLATPFSNFVFEDIVMHGTSSNPIGDFTGGAIPITNVQLRNITIVGPDLKGKGVAMTCVNVSGTSADIVPPDAVCKELQGPLKLDDDAAPLLQTAAITVSSDGSYAVPGADGKGWLTSVPPRLRSNSTWLELSLKQRPSPVSGADNLGEYHAVEFTWAGGSTEWVTSVRVYNKTGVVVFGQNFTETVSTDGKVGKDSPLSWWPAFNHAADAPALGYLGFSGCMSGGVDVGSFNTDLQQAPKTIQASGGEADSTHDQLDGGGGSNLKLSTCKKGNEQQQWKFLAIGSSDGEVEAEVCNSDAKSCMVENEGSHQCLQLSHCATTDGGVVAADVACKMESMCKGRNLGWRYDRTNHSLISTLSWKCLTAKGGGTTVTQEECGKQGMSSFQIFYYDNTTGRFGPSSSPEPVPTSCLEAPPASSPHGPSGPPKLSAWGGYQSGPLGLFAEDGETKILSPLTEHMSSVVNAGPNGSAAVAVGVGGAVHSVPAGHSMETILFSGQGVRDSYEAWGDAMMLFHGKERTALDHDVFISHLGYSTTSYYFYNQCDCGYHWPRQCNATTAANTPPASLKGCKNYEDTLIAVHHSNQKNDLPVRYFLVDSWWYGERRHGGVWMWEDTPELVSDTFPGNKTHPGMKRLSAELGGMPFKAHAGGWSKGKESDPPNPYFANPDYKFVTAGNTGVPQGPGLWDHVFSVNQKNWNLRAIKQDHMNEQLSMPPAFETVNVARDWLKGMGDAAIKQNFSIQYCMTLPIITMNSVSIHASTHQRLGPDYLDGSNRGNWNIGEAAVFVWGVGLLPFKDTFLSNSKQTPPTHANTGTGSGGFKGFVETAPELHALSALLSAGPVSPSDGIDGANIPLLKSLCRSDGMLLKPEKPARAIDAQWIGQVFNVSSPGGSPSGVLWTTATTLPGSDRTWSYVLSVSSEKDWSASAETLNLPGGTNATRGYTWTRPRAMYASEPVTLSEFSESEPLSIPAGASADYNDGMFTYLNTVPTLDNGMVLVGELSKQVPVSRQRIATISAAAGSKTIELGVLGAPGETVEMSYLEKDCMDAQSTSVTIGPDGTAHMSLTSTM